MNNTIRILIIFLSVFAMSTALSAYPGEDAYEKKFYEAYVTGNMQQWPDWIMQMEMSYNHSREPQLLYDIIKAHYGYVAYLIGVEKDETAARFIEKGEAFLEKLKAYNGYQTEYEAMKGAFLAFKIGIKRSRAVFLGPRSMEHINRAVELDPSNPMAWMEKGNAEYHMPRIFGGSYEKAAQYFEKAVDRFESRNNGRQKSWMYMNALAWLAQSYDKAKKDEKAGETYQKILALEPDFKWVKEELYPEFKDNHRQ